MDLKINVIFLGLILLYFGLLYFISRRTSSEREISDEGFYLAHRRSPWWAVAIGMIGATLSGITFLSVPGWVGSTQLSYIQMVLGYLVGYWLIAYILLPLYYRLGLVSIYGYLQGRFGKKANKTASIFFVFSKLLAASFRLFVVLLVIDQFVIDDLPIPFFVLGGTAIAIAWVYTYKGGMRTIVWTDLAQTIVMLASLGVLLWALSSSLDIDSWPDLCSTITEGPYSQVFFFEDGWSDSSNFFKSFFAGVFLTIAMTGLDQDMMQKNLSCKTLGQAKKNMLWFSWILALVTIMFLVLGVLLYQYADVHEISIPMRNINGQLRSASDLLLPEIVLSHLALPVQLLFLLGLIAAAYSSIDSSMTAITTSIAVDIVSDLGKGSHAQSGRRRRADIHLASGILIFILLLIFYRYNESSAISSLFQMTGYSYGPILGLFVVGLFSTWEVNDHAIPYICLASPLLTYAAYQTSQQWGYSFGFELLLVNGLFTIVGLWLFRVPRNQSQTLS